jgi:hypothetical protein
MISTGIRASNSTLLLMPTGGNQTSPGRSSGSDNGWIGVLTLPPLIQFLEELKTHPNLPYIPSGEGLTELIPKELQ